MIGEDGALRTLRVSRAEPVAEGVLALTLADPNGAELPPWTPGAHIDLHLESGLVRQYSLCSAPWDRSTYRVAVLRVPGGRGGSAHVHDRLRQGSTLPVSAPRNHFELADTDSHLLVAGGIGITPLLPMAHELTRRGKPWRMLYAGRSRSTMAFLDELPAGDRITVQPEDETGRPNLAEFLARDPEATVHACGPEGMLEAVRALHSGPVYTERFTPAQPASTAESAFTVHLSRSGLTLPVPAGRSILDVIRDAGVPADSSCESGICGTCETKVLHGTPEHRDDLLTDEEQGAGDTMMICVSRSLGSRIDLDL